MSLGAAALRALSRPHAPRALGGGLRGLAGCVGASGGASDGASGGARADRRPVDPTAPRWHYLSGFSFFVSRQDLERVLGDIVPLEIDPLLDQNLYPSGKYALLLTPEQASSLSERVKTQQTETQKLTMTSNEYKIASWKRSSAYEISNRTVRTRNMPFDTDREELAFLFEKYGIADEGIMRIMDIPTGPQPAALNMRQAQQFIVQFRSAEEAERAVIDYDGGLVEGSEVALIWYSA